MDKLHSSVGFKASAAAAALGELAALLVPASTLPLFLACLVIFFKQDGGFFAQKGNVFRASVLVLLNSKIGCCFPQTAPNVVSDQMLVQWNHLQHQKTVRGSPKVVQRGHSNTQVRQESTE